MARRVFFSFHYQRDAIRVSQIRECNTVSNHFEQTPFLKGVEWESIERAGDSAIQKWIDTQMNGCGVVIVLAGYETSTRKWVKYELEKAHREGKGILCIDMTDMRNMYSQVDPRGVSPLTTALDSNGRTLASLNKYRTYSWEGDLGRLYIDKWIESAAIDAGK